MFNALKNYIDGSANKVVSKDEVVDASEAMFNAISKNVIPSLKETLDSDEFFSSDKINLIENIGLVLDMKTTNPKEIIKELLSFYKDVLAEEKNFMKLIDTQLPDKLFPALFTAQSTAIMKVISDLTSSTLYVLDLLYFIVIDKDTEYSKHKVESLRSNIPYFTSVVRPYRDDFGKYVDTLYKVSKNEINKDAPASLMDKLLHKHGKVVKLPIINGFINNPVYHVRLWLADRDLEKYESLKEKKKLLELKLLDLKLKANGDHDEKLSKQIEYYEDKISGMEYKIKDLEGDD